MKLRHHGIELASVEDPHEGGLDHIVEMVAQSDFIAAQSLGVGVEKSPAHPGAEIAGILLHLDRDVKDVAFKYSDGNPKCSGIFLDQRPVGSIIARVHHQEGQLEGLLRMALELLHQLGQNHGVLPAGNTYGDPVSGTNQLVSLYRRDKGVPERLAIGFDETALGNLLRGKFTGHRTSKKYELQIHRN
mgnify:CR=1 FL=1